MMKSLTAVVPLCVPWWRQPSLVAQWPSFLSEFDGSSYRDVKIWDDEVDVKVRWLNEDSGEVPKHLTDRTRAGNIRDWVFFEASCHVNAGSVEKAFSEVDTNRIDMRSEAHRLLADEMERFIHDLGISVSLARPGIFASGRPLILVDGTEITEHLPRKVFSGGLLWEFEDVNPHPSWPETAILPLDQTWSWLLGIPGFQQGVPSGRAGRAVAALSHLLEARPPSGLMYALLGLEALYCESTRHLLQQLREKAQLVLGAPTEHKKAFRDAYGFRSRFVHGDINLPLAYTPYDANPDFERFSSESYKAESLVSQVLVATVQKMVAEDLYDLEFRYEWLANKR